MFTSTPHFGGYLSWPTRSSEKWCTSSHIFVAPHHTTNHLQPFPLPGEPPDHNKLSKWLIWLKLFFLYNEAAHNDHSAHLNFLEQEILKKKWDSKNRVAMLDSDTTRRLVKTEHELTITVLFNIKMLTDDGQLCNTAKVVDLLLPRLSPQNYKVHILWELSINALKNIKVLAENGYLAVFHQNDVSIQNKKQLQLTLNKPRVLQRWRIKTESC